MFTDMEFWGPFFFASEWAIRLGMLAVVPMRRSPQAASAWLLLTLVSPWAALGLYLLIGWPKMPRWREQLRSRLPELFGGVLGRLRDLPSATMREIDPSVAQAARLATHLGHLQPLESNRVELLGDYDGVIEQLVADIDKAANHVHLIFYIYGVDPTADRVTDALARTVKRGVTCRVLVDSIGSKKTLKALLPKLASVGVLAYRVLPVGLFRRRAIRFRPQEPPQDRRDRRPDRVHRLAEPDRRGFQETIRLRRTDGARDRTGRASTPVRLRRRLVPGNRRDPQGGADFPQPGGNRNHHRAGSAQRAR